MALAPKVLEGRFSKTAANSGNFVLVFSGHVGSTKLQSYKALIQQVFGPSSLLCPIQGFTWMQLRDIPVRDRNGFVTDDQLCLNSPPTPSSPLNGSPFHLTSKPILRRPGTLTVALQAFVDSNNTVAAQAMRDGVCMFGGRVKVVTSGDIPTLIQCGRCHKLGHRSNRCSLKAKGHFKCLRCDGPHHTSLHDTNCKAKTHARTDVCDCKHKCILCKQAGHDARSRKCPMKGDFGPPLLIPLPPTDVLPEDTV